jgi:hypothetical protein
VRLVRSALLLLTTTDEAGEIGVFQARFTGLITAHRLFGATYFPAARKRGPKRAAYVEAIPHMPSSWVEAAD